MHVVTLYNFCHSADNVFIFATHDINKKKISELVFKVIIIRFNTERMGITLHRTNYFMFPNNNIHRNEWILIFQKNNQKKRKKTQYYIYRALCLIFLLVRLNLLMRFFLHLARIPPYTSNRRVTVSFSATTP